jgi:orotate phosphoribosyltransferase
MVLKTALSNLRYGRRTLIRTEDAITLVRDWCSKLPIRYDLLVGIPRAGLLFANFMALELSIPLATPEMLPSYWSGKSIESGPVRNILIVEDMTKSGTQVKPLKKKVQELFPTATVHIGAVYSPEGGMALDTYASRLDGTSITEWDFLDEQVYQNVAVDMDGVLCQDCPPGITETNFDDWARNAIPYLIPRFKVQAIITSRLERSRMITDEWLRKYGIKYYNLLCDPSRTLHERDLIGWKVHCINQRKPQVFVESDAHVAQEVHWRTGVPVVCVSNMRMYSD